MWGSSINNYCPHPLAPVIAVWLGTAKIGLKKFNGFASQAFDCGQSCYRVMSHALVLSLSLIGASERHRGCKVADKDPSRLHAINVNVCAPLIVLHSLYKSYRNTHVWPM
jgi:hypothetical protein